MAHGKTLVVLRHGHAKDGSEDFDRRLSARGERDVDASAHELYDTGVRFDYILTSSAPRAARTAELVAAVCGFTGGLDSQQALYLADPPTYCRALQQVPNTVNTLLLVGHNPGLSALVARLSHRPGNLDTAHFIKLALEIEQWSEVEGLLE